MGKYYVDNIIGNDNNTGNKEFPWKTIQKAADTAVAGDTVIVNSGIYRESITIKDSGNERDTIVYTAEGEVVISGANILSDHSSEGWTNKGDGVWCFKYPEILPFGWNVLDHHVSTNASMFHVSRREMVIIDGKVCGTVAYQPDLMPWMIYAAGNTCPDLGPLVNPTIFVHFPEGKSPGNSLIEYGTSRHQLYIEASYITIDGFTFRHYAGGYHMHGVSINGSNNIFRNTICEWSNYDGFALSGSNHYVENVETRDNGCIGHWIISAEYCTFRNIKTIRNNWKGYNFFCEAGAAKIAFSHHCVFDRIYAADNDGIGYWLDGWNFHNTISNSMAINNKYAGFMLEMFTEYTKMFNNISCYNRGMGLYISNAVGNVIVHNTIFRNEEQGLNIWRDSERSTRGGRNLIYNNIFANNGKHEIRVLFDDTDNANFDYADLFSNKLDGNIYWKSCSNTPFGLFGTLVDFFETNEIEAWRAKWVEPDHIIKRCDDYDANSLCSNPKLENTSTEHGWRISEDSPARGFGVIIPGYTIDEIFEKKFIIREREEFKTYIKEMLVKNNDLLNMNHYLYVCKDCLGTKRPDIRPDTGAFQYE